MITHPLPSADRKENVDEAPQAHPLMDGNVPYADVDDLSDVYAAGSLPGDSTQPVMICGCLKRWPSLIHPRRMIHQSMLMEPSHWSPSVKSERQSNHYSGTGGPEFLGQYQAIDDPMGTVPTTADF